MQRRFMWSFILVVLAAFVAAGCGSDDSGDGDSGDGKSKFDGKVKLGAILPLTGGLGDFGKAGGTAADIAIEEANKAAKDAGLKGKVTLAKEDGETTEEGGKAAAEKLVRSGGGVDCIAGDWPSGSTKAVAESVTIDEGIPLISPSSTNPGLTDVKDDNLLFRTAPSDLVQSKILAKLIGDDLGGKGTVSVGAINNDYGAAFAKEFKTAAEAEGLTVNEPVLYDPTGTQFETEAGQIVEGNPDAFVIVDYPDQGWPKMGPALVRTGDWDPAKTYSADGLRSESLPTDLGKETTEGMRGTAPTSVKSGAADAFDKLWTEKDEGSRQTYDAQNFDAVMLCYLGAVAAGANDNEINDNLQDISGPPGLEVTVENLSEGIEALIDGKDIDYEGASGPINWDEKGDPTAADYEIWQYKGGKLEGVDTIAFGGDEDAEEDSTTETTEG